MTNGWNDIANADVVLAMGGNPAENHPVGFRWVMEAKRNRNAKLVCVDPRFQRTAAVADCFVLTFRSLAKYSRLPWLALTCRASGTLDRPDRVPQFTAFTVKASLRVPDNASVEQARRILARAEQGCLISNSLKGRVTLEAEVEVDREAHAERVA